MRLIGLLALTLPVTAIAQEVGFSAHDTQLSAFDGDVRDPVLLHRPDFLQSGAGWLAAAYEYAHRPLVRYGDSGATREPLIEGTHALHLNGGVALGSRGRFDIAAPFFFNANNPDGSGTHRTIGDIALTAMIEVVAPQAEDEGLGLGVYGRLSLPTGDAAAGLGDAGGRFEPGLAATWASGPIALTANAGLDLRKRIDPVGGIDNPDRFVAGAAVGVAVGDRTGVSLEGRFAAPLSAPRVAGQATPAEVLLSGRRQIGPVAHAMLGVATGVGPGVGAAAARVFAGVGVSFGRDAPQDVDGDGFFGRDDACPEAAEVLNGYLDTDGCPDALADVSIQALYNGEPVADATGTVTVAGQTQDAPWLGLLPGQGAEVSAASGCAQGQASTQLVEGVNIVAVDMSAQRPYTVTVKVRDRSGGDITLVQTTWEEPPIGCVSAPGIAMTEARGSQQVGEQPLELLVNAQGFRPTHLTVFDQASWPEQAATYEVVLRPLRPDVNERQLEVPQRILFEVDTDRLHPSSQLILDDVAKEIGRLANNARVEVEGHTDSTASDAYNQTLSEQRAKAVVDYLVTKGVPTAMLTARGFGEAEPVQTNSTTAGRQANRRVVFTVLTPR